MIQQLRVERFKCFLATELDLCPLVVLTGLNGAGKTSLIHALLLARQASTGTDVVPLNGPFGLTLGEATDVLTLNAEPEEGIGVAVKGADDNWSQWRLGVGSLTERRAYLEVIERPEHPPRAFVGNGLEFTYLSAERLGPRDVLSTSSDATDLLGVGCQGEYTAQVLALPTRPPVREQRQHPVYTVQSGSAGLTPVMDRHGDGRLEVYTAQSGNASLTRQAECWMSDIVRPIEIDAKWYAGTSVASLRFKTPGFRSEWTRPANIGFGVSYALPVIVAGLLAPVGGLLIVENPEAHLHPAGQSAIGAFLARVAADGVQVIIETHSDHVINGVRRAVAEQRILRAVDAVIHFFATSAEGMPEVATLKMNEAGHVSTWPKGFFDQIEVDLAVLARAKRGAR